MEIININDEYDIALARSKTKEFTVKINMGIVQSTKIITATSEIVRNMTDYANGGRVTLEVIESMGNVGLKVSCTDNGPGIEDISVVMQDGYSSKGSLGMGIPGSKRLVNEFAISSNYGGEQSGTTVTLIQWA